MSVAARLKQSVVVANPAGPDLHNKQGYATPVTYNARFEQTYRIIATATQEQTPIDGTVYFSPEASVQIGAKVTYNNVDYRAMVVSEMVGARGKLHHIEVMVQKWNA